MMDPHIAIGCQTVKPGLAMLACATCNTLPSGRGLTLTTACPPRVARLACTRKEREKTRVTRDPWRENVSGL